jgi:cytochrome bd-type quinol oxidase subunit 2
MVKIKIHTCPAEILHYSSEKNFSIYFICCLIFIWGSGQIIGVFFSMLYPELNNEIIADLRSTNLIALLLIALMVAPILETAILVYSIHISKQIFPKSMCVYLSIFPICFLHLFDYWQLFFIVLFPFYFQAVAYISVRGQRSRRSAFLFLTALHFFANLFSMAMNIFSFLI